MPSIPSIKTGISRIKPVVKITEILSKEVEKSLGTIYANPGKFGVQLGGQKDHGHAIQFVTISGKSGKTLGLLFHIGDKSIVVKFGEDPAVVEPKPGKRTVNPPDIGASDLGYPEIHFETDETALRTKLSDINNTRSKVRLPPQNYEIKKMMLVKSIGGKDESLNVWAAIPKVD